MILRTFGLSVCSLIVSATCCGQELGVPATQLPLPQLGDKSLIDDTELLPKVQDVVATAPEGKGKENPAPALLQKFKKLMTGAKLTGQFTVDGKPLNELQEESYEIESVEKLPTGDDWVITSRIKYGTKDLVVPVPIEVKWAGSTPVLTLDNLTLPGFGTFSARVVLHGDKYAGTWQHDSVGGHLFGRIELPQVDANQPAE